MMEYVCQVAYAGRWAPQMTWTDRDNAVITSIDSGFNGWIVSHAISVEATVERNNDAFTCTTNFGALDPAPGENEADNIPDYQNVQSFSPVTVHCKYTVTTLASAPALRVIAPYLF